MSMCLGQVEGVRVGCTEGQPWLCMECRELLRASLKSLARWWPYLRLAVRNREASTEECSRAGARTGSPALVDMDAVDIMQTGETAVGSLATEAREKVGWVCASSDVEVVAMSMFLRFERMFESGESEGLVRAAITDLPALAKQVRQKVGAEDVVRDRPGVCRVRGCEASIVTRSSPTGDRIECRGAERHEFPIGDLFTPYEGRYDW